MERDIGTVGIEIWTLQYLGLTLWRGFINCQRSFDIGARREGILWERREVGREVGREGGGNGET